MLSNLLYRLRALFRRAAVERELDEELRFHVEREAEKYVRAGLPSPEAARQARLKFGGSVAVAEACRDARGLGWLESSRRNLRYALRLLRRQPGFAFIAIATLALGIGANSAVFSAIDTILLSPLPFPNGNRLMLLEQYEPRSANPSTPVAPVRVEDWNRLNATFQAITGYYIDDISETSGELPERLACAWVAPRFLDVWDVAPFVGRAFAPAEERFGGPMAVVISHRLWVRRFGSDPRILSRQLRVADRAYQIVGVMPPSFAFPVQQVDVWLPNPLGTKFSANRALTWFTVVGRVKPGVSLDEARNDLTQVQARLGRQFPDPDARLAVRIQPLKDAMVGGLGRSLWILFGAVTLLLLIAATNIAALLLARTADREREISIRTSLGASRRAVVAQLVTEALVLAVAGAIAGLGVAAAAIRLFHGLAGTLPRMDEVHLNWTLAIYALASGAGVTLLFGSLPALQGTGRSVTARLAATSRTVVPARTRLQWLLVGVQVALAVTLLVGAGLLLRSFERLGRVSPGFETTHILTFRVSGNWAETGSMTALWRRIDTTLDFLRTLPGVKDAATALAVPGVPFDYQLEVRIPDAGTVDRRLTASARFVSAGYFSTMGIPVLEGESCRDSASLTALVNRNFVERYLGGVTPIGRRVEQVPVTTFNPGARIVGIAADTREEGLNRDSVPMVYWCNNAPVPTPLFLVRSGMDPGALAQTIRRRLHDIEPGRSVYEIRPLEAHLGEALSESRLRLVLLTLFAVSAVALAALGLYGTLSYLVSMRRREVGVRMAMGAPRGRIASQFVRQGLTAAIAGAAAGLALAAASARVLSGMLYGVSPLDPLTFTGVPAIVIVTSVAASLWPALRAARVEPIEVLRDE
jgi:putative ABC transport system permease protein